MYKFLALCPSQQKGEEADLFLLKLLAYKAIKHLHIYIDNNQFNSGACL